MDLIVPNFNLAMIGTFWLIYYMVDIFLSQHIYTTGFHRVEDQVVRHFFSQSCMKLCKLTIFSRTIANLTVSVVESCGLVRERYENKF